MIKTKSSIIFLLSLLVANVHLTLLNLETSNSSVVHLIEEKADSDLQFKEIISLLEESTDGDFKNSAKLTFVLLKLYEASNNALRICYKDPELSRSDIIANSRYKDKDIFSNFHYLRSVIRNKDSDLYKELYENAEQFEIQVSNLELFETNKNLMYQFISKKFVKLLNNIKYPSFFKMFSNFFNPGEKYEDKAIIKINNSQNNNNVTFDFDEFIQCLKDNMGFDILADSGNLKGVQMRGKISLFERVQMSLNNVVLSGVFCVFHYVFTFFYNRAVKDHKKWKYCHEEF